MNIELGQWPLVDKLDAGVSRQIIYHNEAIYDMISAVGTLTRPERDYYSGNMLNDVSYQY